jgi:uncharacterized protein (DUF1330 family)
MTVPAYAIGYLRDVAFGDDIIRYMREIDGTLAPYGGEFVIHGGRLEPKEGQWDGDVVVIRFPDRHSAEQWFDSPAYQRIVPLRVDNSRSMIALVDGVKPGHTGASKVAELQRRDP